MKLYDFPLAPIVLVLLTAATLIGVQSAKAAGASIPRYHKFETSFALPGQTGNPYDPQENDVNAVFKGPGSERIVVPAFWDGTQWRVRFAPRTVGDYALSIMRNGHHVAAQHLGESAFRCTPSDDPGFIHTDPNVVQRFEFDNGKTYYPFGIDVAWQGGKSPGYAAMFGHLHTSGLNWTRVWMTFWDGKSLFWSQDKSKNPPIGYFLMSAADQWDQIFDLAAQDHIYVQMTLQHHGQYTNKVDPNWSENPYNVANGGFLKKPDDFFTDPRAIALTKARYRYIVARWGYSTNLMSFELFNEVQNISEADTHFQDVVAWHRTMAAYIRSIDPYHHMITTSNSPADDPLSKIGLSYDQVHLYVPDLLTSLKGLPASGQKTPMFVGEWGPGGGTKMSEEFVHQGIWAGIMTPMAGAAQFWYWDLVDDSNWWPQFKSASDFLHTYNIASLGDLTALTATADSSGSRADLTFSPPLGWANTTTSNVTIDSNGSLKGIAGMSSYLQGQSHRAMLPKPVVFHLDCPAPCDFTVHFGTIARSGASPVLVLDNKTTRTTNFAPAAQDHPTPETLSVHMPAGAHSVSLFNTGADWATISQIQISNFAPTLAAFVRGNHRSAAFWIYARSSSTAPAKDARLYIKGLTAGEYEVSFWDTHRGVPLGKESVRCENDHLTITLPRIENDIAGVAVKKS